MNKTISRIVAIVIICAFLNFGVSFMVACAKNSDNELIVVTQFAGADGNKAQYDSIVTQFKKDNPNVDIKDRSNSAVDGNYMSYVEQQFVGSEKNYPDVIFGFTPVQNESIKPFLETIANIKNTYEDFARGFDVLDSDPYTVNFNGFSIGIYYEKSQFDKDGDGVFDYTSYTDFITQLKNKENGAMYDFNGEPHYWFNYIGLQMMGELWTKEPTKQWFETYKTLLVEVINELKTVYNAIGGSGSPTVTIDNEDGQLTAGNRALMINGSWKTGPFYPNGEDNDFAQKFAFTSLPFDKMSSEGKQFVMAGLNSNGWMISKKAASNPTKLKNAVEFIQANLDAVAGFGGVPNNGATSETDLPIVVQTRETVKDDGNKIFVAPIDDFLTQDVKSALFGGITAILQGVSKSPESIIDDVLDAF